MCAIICESGMWHIEQESKQQFSKTNIAEDNTHGGK
jgi:hypothetical protein